MRRYYETPMSAELVVPANSSKVFAIPHPTRVRLVSLRVLQTAGTAAAFKADLYKKEVGDSPAANNADDFWLVTTRGGVSSTANGTLVYDFADVDKFFDNKDDPAYVDGPGGVATPVQPSVFANRVIYLRITNSGSTENTYRASIGST